LTEAIQVSNRTARRFILGKQGLWPGRRGRAKAGTRSLMTACEHVQLDPLVIVARSHDLMLHARVAGYRPELFHQLTYTERRFFDWGGWLAVRPMHELPYWRVLMRRARQNPGMRRIDEHLGATLTEMRAELRDRGTLSSRDFAAADRLAVDTYRGKKDSSLALYYLWLSGEAMTHHREGFERVYALTEVVAPAALIAEADEAAADRFIVRKHVAFGGIGRIGPLSRMLGRKVPRAEELAIVRELVETNEITPVEVGGSSDRAFMLTADLARLRSVDAGRVPKTWRPLDATTEEEVALLSPLDPVLERRRARALFGFDYVWEIYKRPDLVQYGRFAMPVLWGDRLAGRVDLRTDRATKTLIVNGVWLECDADAKSTAFRAALRAGLVSLTRLVGADRIDASAVTDARLRRVLQLPSLHR
jgi:uncharacterized protein YcaQ